jgi:hypothetical protein
MPIERAACDDFLAAAEHIRMLTSITDEIGELIPCGLLSKKEEAEQLRAIPEFLVQCALDDSTLVRILRSTIRSLLTIFDDEDRSPQ